MDNPIQFNEKELIILKAVMEDWLSEGFISVSNLRDEHCSILKKLDIKVILLPEGIRWSY